MTVEDRVARGAARDRDVGAEIGPDSAASRSRLFKQAAAGLGGLAITLGVGAGFAAASDSAKPRDGEVLAFALVLEELQSAFYAHALRAGTLSGEVRQFAEVVGGHERKHADYVQRRLAGPRTRAPAFQFSASTMSNKDFMAAAITLEETGLAAYNGQVNNLSAAALRYLAPVISVEARHVAWARDLAGSVPAPAPADAPVSAAAALQAIKPYLARP